MARVALTFFAACGTSTPSQIVTSPRDASVEANDTDATALNAPDAHVNGGGEDASDSDAYTDPRECKYGASVDEDDWIEAKNQRCCGDGLVFTDVMHVGDGGACEDIAPPSVKLCTKCGDGLCVAPENHCNCPADCP